MNIYQSNTFRKDLSRLHFETEPGVQDKYQVKDQQSYIPISVAYPTCPSRNLENQPGHDNIISCKTTCWIYRKKEPPRKKETS